jgi:hypothetical protein
LRSGGPLRSRRDTPGHATKTVRDREAPGSNPGPPTIFVFKIGDFGRSPGPTGHSRGTDAGISLRPGDLVSVARSPRAPTAVLRSSSARIRRRPRTSGIRQRCESCRPIGPHRLRDVAAEFEGGMNGIVPKRNSRISPPSIAATDGVAASSGRLAAGLAWSALVVCG